MVRRQDLHRLGLNDDVLHEQTRAGLWRVAGPGILVHHTAGPGLLTDTRIAALWRPRSMLTGPSAAVLWPQPAWRDEALPERAMIIDRRSGRGPWRTVRNPAARPVSVAGCLVADRRAILIDLIRFLPPRQALAIATASIRTDITTIGHLTAALPAFASLEGVRQLRWVVRCLESGAHSAGEADLHRALRRARITGWLANLPVAVAGRRFVLDVAFPTSRVYLEYDGVQAHGPGSFDADRDRQNILSAAGWLPIRVTWQMLSAPDRKKQLMARIRQAIAERHHPRPPNSSPSR